MSQLQDTMYQDYPVVYRDITAAAFAVLAARGPDHPGIKYRVNGAVYRWDGSSWVGELGASTDATGKVTGLNLGARNAVSDLNIGGALAIKPSTILARHPGGFPIATSAVAQGTTWHNQIEMPEEFGFVRLAYRSIEAGAIVITSAAIGANDGTVAFPGISGSWTPVTFSGSAKGTIPARIAAGVPSFLVSDWIPLQSLARISGGTYPILCARTYFGGTDGSGAGTGYSYFNYTLNPGLPSPLQWKHAFQTVDGITTPSAFTNTGALSQDVLSGVETMTAKQAITITFPGDSVQAGMVSANGLTSGGYYAIGRMMTGAVPLVYDGSCALHGQNSDNYYAAFLQRIAISKPQIACYQASSINNPINTQARANYEFGLVLKFLQTCWDNGIVPVVQTPWPQFSGNGASFDTYRAAFITRLKNLALTSNTKYPVYICDTAAAVADPTNTWRYLPAYNSGDNSHMTDAGYLAASYPIEATLRLILGM